jgi:hypothetical protein
MGDKLGKQNCSRGTRRGYCLCDLAEVGIISYVYKTVVWAPEEDTAYAT